MNLNSPSSKVAGSKGSGGLLQAFAPDSYATRALFPRLSQTKFGASPISGMDRGSSGVGMVGIMRGEEGEDLSLRQRHHRKGISSLPATVGVGKGGGASPLQHGRNHEGW